MVLRCLIQVPLLEEEKIDEGYDVISVIIEETYCTNEDVQERERWNDFMENYVKKQWGRTVKKKVFSVYGEGDRTKNFEETNNNVTSMLIHEKPTSSDFVVGIHEQKEMALYKLEKAAKGTAAPRKVSLKTALRDSAIHNKWVELKCGTCSVEKFIKELANFEQLELFSRAEKAIEIKEKIDATKVEIDDSDDETEMDLIREWERKAEKSSTAHAGKISGSMPHEQSTHEDLLDPSMLHESSSTKKASRKGSAGKKLTSRSERSTLKGKKKAHASACATVQKKIKSSHSASTKRRGRPVKTSIPLETKTVVNVKKGSLTLQKSSRANKRVNENENTNEAGGKKVKVMRRTIKSTKRSDYEYKVPKK